LCATQEQLEKIQVMERKLVVSDQKLVDAQVRLACIGSGLLHAKHAHGLSTAVSRGLRVIMACRLRPMSRRPRISRR